MSEVVVAWDECTFANQFRSESGDDVSVVTSETDLREELHLDDGQDWGGTGLIILLELDWERHRSRFHGFDIVRDLLLKGFDQPIVLCSFASNKSLYDIPGIGRRLARMPFPFERLPTSPDVLVERARNADSFSDPWLEFVRRNILAEKPYAMCAHDIKGAIAKSDEELGSAVDDALEDLDEMNLGLPENLSKHRDRAEQALEDERYSEAREALRVFVGLLEQHGVQETETEDFRAEDKEKPKSDIILIEDEEDELEYYRRGLERDFKVFAAGHVEEVLSELEENPENREYLAIIADWQLKEEDGKTWQPKQGFELLDEVGRKYGPIYRVALTSLPKSAIASVQNATSSGIYDTYFPKRSVGNTAGYSFPEISEKIKDGIEPIHKLRRRLPDLGPWTDRGEEKTFREAFLELYYSDEWSDEIEEVKIRSNEIIKEYIEYYENKYKNGQKAPSIGESPYNLSAGNYDTEATRGHILKILTLRLISLYLHFEHNLSTKDICPFLIGKSKEYDGSWPGQWYSIVGFERVEGGINIQSILPYEEEWLKKYHGSDIKAIRQRKIDAKERKFVDIVNDGLDPFRGTTVSGEEISVPDKLKIRTAEKAVESLEGVWEQLNIMKEKGKDVGKFEKKFDGLVQKVYEDNTKDVDYLNMLFKKGLGGRFHSLKE